MYDELIKQLRDFAVELRKAEDALLVRDAADAIEELSKPKWIPVTERLPETDDEVVVAFKNNIDSEWWYRIDNFVDGEFCYNAAFNRHIEYWMPLPEPPKEE